MMTKPTTEAFIEYLKSKWQGRPCAMCGVGNWNVSDAIFELRPFHGGGMVLGAGPIVPIIPVTCVNCGNTMMINAMVAKIVQPPPQVSQKEEVKNV